MTIVGRTDTTSMASRVPMDKKLYVCTVHIMRQQVFTVYICYNAIHIIEFDELLDFIG